jgi:hypothetical protein
MEWASGRRKGLTIGGLLEVDVGVAERATSDGVSADADGQDGTGAAELLEEHSLGDVGLQVADVQRRHRVRRGHAARGSDGRSGHSSVLTENLQSFPNKLSFPHSPIETSQLNRRSLVNKRFFNSWQVEEKCPSFWEVL